MKSLKKYYKMLQYKGYKQFQGVLVILSIISRVKCMPQDESTAIKPGRYVPEIYGLGKYIPDDSGKYYHMPRPYDGGYGDRGIRYVHDSSGNLIRVTSDGQTDDSNDLLGPKDHLRFMIDFNYDRNGWQIIKFDWLRDGDENYKYKYVNENQVWNNNNNNANEAKDGETKVNDQNKNDDEVHIDGEYNKETGYNYSYPNEKSSKNSHNLKRAIKEVLDYIEISVLPTL